MTPMQWLKIIIRLAEITTTATPNRVDDIFASAIKQIINDIAAGGSMTVDQIVGSTLSALSEAERMNLEDLLRLQESDR